VQLIAMPGNVLRFDGDLVLEAGTEGSAVGELNVDFGTVLAVFVDGEDADHFVGKFFTFNHRFSVCSPWFGHSRELLRLKGFRYVLPSGGVPGVLSSSTSKDEAWSMTVYLPSRLIIGRECIR
jgi:hypothetical protein